MSSESVIPVELALALAGRYRLERELGAGGMATVYLAEDEKHHRRVAVKVLRPELAAALGPERFLREIETTAALRHPHILPLFDSGEAAGFLFYVMPYVEGESLQDRLAREKQLPLEDALRIAREVADALGYAHARGVVHRDIKPANILLEQGHAVVADFGIARAVDVAGPERLTQPGFAIGTPAYMSPEQAAGDTAIDGRSDLYSLACVLYEMLAGQPPFTGPTAASIAHQHLAAEPRPITQIRPAVPASVAAIIQRALAKNPLDRFSPAAQFAEALSSPATVMTVPGSPRRAWMLGGALAMVAVVATGYLVRRGRASPLPVIVRTAQITREPGLEIDPAISPNGTMVAYAAGSVAHLQLFVRQLGGTGAPVAVATDSSHQHRWPRWSPDGSTIAFQSDEAIFVVPALGGAVKLIVRPDSATARTSRSFSALNGFDWSPDGRRIVYAVSYVGQGLFVVPSAGGAATALAAPAEAHSPAWSPDGARIAVVVGNPIFSFGTVYFGNEGPNTLWVVPVDGTKPIQLTDGKHLESSPRWSRDGRYLYWVSDRGGARDIYRMRVGKSGAAGDPERLTTGVDAHSISLSDDGTKLAYSRFRTVSNIWSIEIPRRPPVSIAEAVPVTTGNQVIEDVDVTRDGQWLVFDSDRNGNADIFKMRASGGTPEPVVSDSANDYSATWSPDGSRIAFHSFRNGNRDVFTVNADGSGLTQRTSSPLHEMDPAWAPDGESLVYEVLDSQDFAILRLEPGAVARTLAVRGDFAQWSPRGDVIAYHAFDGLRLVPARGGESTQLVPNARGTEAFYAAWSADGATVYYLEQGPGGWAIKSISEGGGAPRLLVRFDDPSRQHARYGFATDDRRFWFTLGSYESDVWMLELGLR
jgi:serine/threonine-protein kinase